MLKTIAENDVATICIKPIRTSSRGGYPVTIHGIDPTSHDCLIGEIDAPGSGLIQAQWNLNGTMRGGVDATNLDMRQPVLADVVQTAKKIGAN